MPYTIRDVDWAIQAAMEMDDRKYEMYRSGVGRTIAHAHAIQACFMKQFRNDSQVSNILREAMQDLSKGMYKPSNGKFESKYDREHE